ncbi:NAD(P)-binding domain-containing protein [Oerskovia sp. M15]
MALEKGGRQLLARGGGRGIPFREIAEAIGSRLGLPAVSIPLDELMVPGYFGFIANIVTQSYPASNLITRRTLGWEPAQPSLLADLDNGHYFSPTDGRHPGSRRVRHMTRERIFWRDAESMTTVGFIGSGQIGTTIARLAIEAGHQVVLSNSRGPETLADTVAGLGPQASAATSRRPQRPVTSSWSPCRSAPSRRARRGTGGEDGHRHVQLRPRAGRAHPRARRHVAHLERAAAAVHPGRPAREGVQQHLLQAPAVARPPGGAVDRSYLPIAGDSEPAKAAVTELIDSIGYSVVDAGPLADGWRQATGTPVWGPRMDRTRTRRASRR